MLKKMSGTIRRYRMLERPKSVLERPKSVLERPKSVLERPKSVPERIKTVLVACSGGPDSMALLYGLLRLKNEYNISLAGFHLNHQLRSKESSADERFVRQVFKGLKIPLTVKRANIARYAKIHKLSLEEAARNVRYRLLESAAKKSKAGRIVLGHTLNDNAETVLLNLIRGTGRAGLAGIPPVRDNFIRPLIETGREEIMEFLRTNHIPYRIDRTNSDLRFPRNFIRHKILPLFLTLNPRFFQALDRTTKILSDDEKYLAARTAEARAAAVEERKNGFYLDIRKFQTYNDSIKRRIVKQLKPNLDFELIQKVIESAGGPSGKAAALPDGWKAIREYDRLFIGKTRPLTVREEKRVVFGKVIHYADWRIFAELSDRARRPATPTRQPKGYEIFDCDRLLLPLRLRTRKPGDRFQPLGLRSDKKLKEVLIDDKIPLRRRAHLPLLCDQAGILWILGGRRSGRAKISSKTKNFLVVEASMHTDTPVEGGTNHHGEHG